MKTVARCFVFVAITVAMAFAGTMQSGSGAPSASVGSNGDLYHRMDVPATYGPKASGSWPATYSYILGVGCTTAYHIDRDCDGYGVGTDSNDPNPLFGPDADDNDATVNTTATVLSKYTTILNYLQTRPVNPYSPNHLWYLSSSGNDSTCAVNDSTKPCLTWNGALSKMSAGDALLVRAGTIDNNANYNEPPSGTSAHPTICMSYPGELGVLDHSSSTGYYGPDLSTAQYVILDGLKIASSGAVGSGIGIYTAGTGTLSHVTVRNVEVRDYYRGLWGESGTYVTIENSSFHDNVGEHNVYVGANTSTVGTPGNLIVRGNLMYNASWDNFHDNGLCVGCTLDGNILYSANTNAGGGSANISLQQGWQSGTISNNVVFNSSADAMIFNTYDDGQTSIVTHNQNYNTIVNNTFIHTGRDSSGQDIGSSGFCPIVIKNESAVACGQPSAANGGTTGAACDLGHNTYANNIFIEGSSKSGASGYNCVVSYDRQLSTDPNYIATDTWANNILYASNGSVSLRMGVGCGTSPCPAQTWATFQSSAASFTNNLQSDPTLGSWNASYYNTPYLFSLIPQSGSPAIGAASTAYATATDIYGATRSSTAPTIGAVEVSSGTASNTLTVSTSGTGTGSVTNTSNCATGANSVTDGATVTCGQSAGAGSTFAGWSGSCGCSGTGSCSFSMPASTCGVVATFNQNVSTVRLLGGSHKLSGGHKVQ